MQYNTSKVKWKMQNRVSTDIDSLFLKPIKILFCALFSLNLFFLVFFSLQKLVWQYFLFLTFCFSTHPILKELALVNAKWTIVKLLSYGSRTNLHSYCSCVYAFFIHALCFSKLKNKSE